MVYFVVISFWGEKISTSRSLACENGETTVSSILIRSEGAFLSESAVSSHFAEVAAFRPKS